MNNIPVVQLAEPFAHNKLVTGSSPVGNTNIHEVVRSCLINFPKVAENMSMLSCTMEDYIDKLCRHKTGKELDTNRVTKFNKLCYPNKSPKSLLLNHILDSEDLKYCGKCLTVYNKGNFRPNSRNSTGINSHCKSCQSTESRKTQPARQANYRANKIKATPKWADLNKISEIYRLCPEGYHVDHEIPLQGSNVCGLHVETNLQYLTARDNLIKHNKY